MRLLCVLAAAFLGHLCVARARMVAVEPTPAEARFWKWLQDYGADVSALVWPAMDVKTGSRGVMARRTIHSSMEGADVYLRIPDMLMVTESKALNDPFWGKAIASYSTGEKWTTEFDRIAFYLIFLRNQTDSFFFPYMDILPGPSTSSDWTDKELAELQDHTMMEISKEQMDAWKAKRRSLDPKYFPPELFTWENVYWAFGNMNQRAFSIRDEDNELLYNAMVPGADLLNHVNIGTHYKMVGHNYVLYPVSSDIKEGDECFNGYGLASNAHLLEHYGFALNGNVFDEVFIEFSVKRKTAESADEPMRLTLRDPLAAQDENIVGEAIRNFPGKSLEERSANCVAVCTSELARHPTSLYEDYQLLRKLKRDDSTMRYRFALHYRIGRKEILTLYKRVCERMKKAVRLSSDLDDGDGFDEVANRFALELESGWFTRFTPLDGSNEEDDYFDGQEEL